MLELLTPFEGEFLLWVQNCLRQDWLNPLVEWFTTLGNQGLGFILLCLALALFPKTRRAGCYGLLAMLFGLIFTNGLLKHLVARPRPWVTFPAILPLVVELDPNSFPSGHTTAAFACCMTLWRYAPRGWMKGLCVAVAALMGMSRLYVGVHYPSDVLTGVAVGCLCALGAWAVERYGIPYLKERKKPSR